MELENELSYVSYLDLAGQFDSEYNMPTNTRAVNTRNSTTETYYSNDCHPKVEGYNQIAYAVYRDLTWRLNNN